jgi:hypothetical protein
MIQFFRDLLSGQSDTSSKRFAALLSLFCIIIMTFIATFCAENCVTPEFMFDGLALIAGGGLGLTVIEKIFTKKKETPIVENQEPKSETLSQDLQQQNNL